MPKAPTPTAAETWMLLAALVFDNRHSWSTQVTDRTGLPFSRYRALRRLESGPRTGTQLADVLDIDAAATSVIVSDLVDRGLVTKTCDPTDGRRRVILITDAGTELLQSLRRDVVPAPIIGALDEDERVTLHQLLTKMQEATR